MIRARLFIVRPERLVQDGDIHAPKLHLTAIERFPRH